jgi:heparin/heparan-sulfate lyase
MKAMKRIFPVMAVALAAYLAAGTFGPARPLAATGARVAPAPVAASAHPRMLIAIADPFSSLAALKAKYAAGERPSDELAGWALSYLIGGDETSARRALDELRRVRLPPASNSGPYLEYVRRALAFDWLYDCPLFDAALKDQVAAELLAGAERIAALQGLADPAQASYHNHSMRELALATFALTAIEGHPSTAAKAAPLVSHMRRALDNMLEISDLVDPGGGYHESTDYMRITFAPLAMLAELRRTTTGEDPARRFGVFANMGPTYLYKVLPDGSEARDDDNEYPHLDATDDIVLGYAIHRFKDPYAAWLLQKSGWLPAKWRFPVLEFLWSDRSVVARDPALARPEELPRHRLFTGVGHLLMRSGWDPGATWIEFTCGPYFAKHDHLDTNQFTIYHKGYLALDTGADYTDTESPHYLNYYRRTVAHNTILVYQPGERFFWGENLWPAANDGGQRMDSSRFWNSVRSLEDWERTRDLWDRGRIEAFEAREGEFVYARGNGTASYQPSKMTRFVRDLLWLEGADVLVVSDDVRVTDATYRKVWLLHGVGEPKVEVLPGGASRSVGQGGTAWTSATSVTFEDGAGRMRVYPVLPQDRELIVRGGPGWEFWTPGDERGGSWGSGANWPLDPPEGGPLPADQTLQQMWRTFWGADFNRLSPSNRRAVVPGGWRLEVSPASAARDDRFLNVLEIGDRNAAPRRIEPAYGHNLAGAVVDGLAAALFVTSPTPPAAAEVTMPDVPSPLVIVAGLEPGRTYVFQLTSNFAPGSPVAEMSARATDAGLVKLIVGERRNVRIRLRRVD